VKREPLVGHSGQPLRGDLELACRLLHEGARAPAARRLHEDLLGLAEPVAVKKIVFMSSPPISDNEAHVGMQPVDGGGDGEPLPGLSLPPQRGAMKPAPEPVKKMRSRPATTPLALHALEELVDFSAWRVLWRW